MFGVLKSKWKTKRPAEKFDNDKDIIVELGKSKNGGACDPIPTRYLNVSHGKISFYPPTQRISSADLQEKDSDNSHCQAKRIAELEGALYRLQERVNQSQYGMSTREKELKEQMEDMSKAIKIKERRKSPGCSDHKCLQDKFDRQECALKDLQNENRALQKRIQQYEKCLDDVTKKVIDAIINEDRLRLEVGVLRERVLDLETQGSLSKRHARLPGGSPAKGRDDGYCTMPPTNATLENLPEEEPEQYVTVTCSTFTCCGSDGIAEPCTAEMEEWSMSQEDVGATIALEDEWMWKEATSLDALPNNDDKHANLLDNPIAYSDDDDELVCKEFTSDYYRLVNLASESNKSLVLENDNNEFNPVSSDEYSGVDHCNDEDSDCPDFSDEEEDQSNSQRINHTVEKKENEKNTRSKDPTQLNVSSGSSSSGSSHELLESSSSSNTEKMSQQTLPVTSISLPNTPAKKTVATGGVSRIPPALPTRRYNLSISSSFADKGTGSALSGSKSFISTTPLWRPSTGWRRVSSDLIAQATSSRLATAAEIQSDISQILRPKTNGSLVSSSSSSNSVGRPKPVCKLRSFKH